ncbi:MAG: AEC family transporter [Clostridiales bacterium]|nr:AEC family transporter [Clostridiales bacterium]
MIVAALIKKIISLFLIMFSGALLVRLKILKAGDSKVLSLLTLYLIIPCAIINAFQVDFSLDIKGGLLLALCAAVIIQLGTIFFSWLLKKTLKLDPVEQCSAVYSNAANLIIPLISAMLGEEWVIFTCPFTASQLFLIWSHGKSVLCGERGFSLKKVLTNTNLIAVFVGVVMLLTGFSFPAPVQDAIGSVSAIVGPIAMLVTGMILGGMDLKKVFTYKRVWLVTFLRLVLLPIPALLLVKFSGLASLVPGGETVLLIVLMASSTPTAGMITQMSQVYGQDADYASAINVVSTLMCVFTLPVVVALYQL